MGWLELVDASLFVIIGCGIGNLSRTAAILGLLLYLHHLGKSANTLPPPYFVPTSKP